MRKMGMKMLSSTPVNHGLLCPREISEVKNTGEEAMKVDSRQVSRPIMPR